MYVKLEKNKISVDDIDDESYIEQIKKLDTELRDVISAMAQDNPATTKARLSLIKWMPVGEAKIDEEMDRYYAERVDALMSQI